MDISTVNRDLQPAPGPTDAVPKETIAENRELVRAVKALNGTEMFGQDNELMFQRDADTRHIVVRVVNRKTREVISQVPAEYVLRMARDLTPHAE